MPLPRHNANLAICGCRHFLAPSKLFLSIKSSRIPEGGWTLESFRSREGLALVRDQVNVTRAAKAKGARMLTRPLTHLMRGQVEDVLSRFSALVGVSGSRQAAQSGTKASTSTISVRQHEDLWAQAITEAFAKAGASVTVTVKPAMQSVADDVLEKHTTLLTGGKPTIAARHAMRTQVNELALEVTQINDTTRKNLQKTIAKAIDQGKHPFEVMEIVRNRIPEIATNRVPTIVRTEMGRAADRATIRAMKESAVVTHVSVTGCEAIEKGIPTWNGIPTCNIRNVPIEYAGDLRFHPNHTGSIVSSGFLHRDGSTPKLDPKPGEGIGTWEDRGKPVPAVVQDSPPPKPTPPPQAPPAPPAPKPPAPPKPPKPAPAAPPAPAPKPVVPNTPPPAPVIPAAPAPAAVLPPIDLTDLVPPAPVSVPVVPPPPKPVPVTSLPQPPKPPTGIHSPSRMVVWDGDAQLHAGEVLNGVPFSEPAPKFWESVADVELGETPMVVPSGMRKGSGVVVVEPDGRVWIVEPTNHYGGYEHTFPKGGVGSGLSTQQNALKEAFEESGLEVEITGLLGDFHGTTSVSRYYVATRKGGAPWLHGWESQAVKLVPQDALEPMLNMQRDKEILAALKLKLSGKPVPAPAPKPVTPTAAPAAPKPAPKPKPKPKPVIEAAVDFPSSAESVLAELRDVGSAGGSTGARIMESRATGQRFILKRGLKGDAADRLIEEGLADEIYRTMGVRVPQGRIYTAPDGTVLKLTKFLDGEIKTLGQYLDTATSAQRSAILEDARQMFHVDAWLGNWDVAGQSLDNMLVVGGKVWRVDNGGALRWRAQGMRKTDFAHTVSEVWTMRNQRTDWRSLSSPVNSSAHKVFGGLKPYDLCDMILASEGDFIDALQVLDSMTDIPGLSGLKSSLTMRFDDLMALANRGQQWRSALMDEAFFDTSSYHMNAFAVQGYKEKLPIKLKPRSRTDWTIMVDENGVQWDHLRGQDALGERWLRQFAKVHGIPEDAACNLVGGWASTQAGSSWGSDAVKFKAWVTTHTLDRARITPDDFYWGKDGTQSLSGLELRVTRWVQKHGLTREQADGVLTAWHAMQQSILENVEMPNVDKLRGIARVFRTEGDSVCSIYNLKTDQNPNGKNNLPYRRGANESTSTVWAKSVYGHQIYEHAVPLSRIMGIYPVSKPISGYRGVGLFAGDHENEFSVNLLGIRARYLGNINRYSDTMKIKPYSSRFEDWDLIDPYE